ncbi:ribonuclease Z [Psychrobacillus psychrodurans]|uniref:ribonuclease Z n=1 Tax=Psychrobacillus psychrodurans TaxID=126157 RepID=UPI0008EBFA0C|nr:ribonuclease Z [Psychrobacillus psychrodurans]MCZ8539730.1 ribonuclease Z [Psychrobacillus psychrodurans]SFM93521.1 ribonuclease Z [Psychrobacillus psychrodurans]
MQLLFLGTGAGMPSKQRNTTSTVLKLLEERGSFWMFDCGEATQHQILHTTLKPRKLEKLFITHLHGDHIYGLPGLLGSRSFLGGLEPLTIYGPTGLKNWIEVTLSVSKTHVKYPLTIIEIEEGVVFEDEEFIVEAKLLEHVVPCFGYTVKQKALAPELYIEKTDALGVPRGPLLKQLKEGHDVLLPDGKVVKSEEVTGAPKEGFKVTILGDTKYCDNSIWLSENADIVVHEGTFDIETAELARLYGHSTIVDAAEVCEKANAKHLIVNHISARFMPPDLNKMLSQVEKYSFPIYIAEDFKEYSWINGTLIPLK